MEILMISDFLELPESNDLDQFKHITWESSDIVPLQTYDAIIIDMTHKDLAYSPQAKRLLHDLSTKLSKRDYLDKNSIIMPIVCSANEEVFNVDQVSDDPSAKASWDTDVFSNYEFLKHLMFGHEANMYYEDIGYRFVTPLTPSTAYLDLFRHETGKVSYVYSEEQDQCRFVKPLAKPKITSMELAAFECVIGRGMVILLPGYSMNLKDEAQNELVKMWKIHYRQRYQETPIYVLTTIESKTLRQLAENAHHCFKYGLYPACLVMCRKVVERSLKEKGQAARTLEKLIDKMYDDGEINEKQRDAGHLVRLYGNKGAHGSEDYITEVQARDALCFFEYFFKLRNQRQQIIEQMNREQ